MGKGNEKKNVIDTVYHYILERSLEISCKEHQRYLIQTSMVSAYVKTVESVLYLRHSSIVLMDAMMDIRT